MNFTIEYKGTSESKFTFTLDEVRIKVAEKNRGEENNFITKANKIYDALVTTNWNGLTLRMRPVKGSSLLDSNKNVIASINNDTVIWKSEKGTK